VYGPCRSAIGGDQALTPPTRHSLGKPLPYQLADRPQASPRADYSIYPYGNYRELANLSASYARLWGKYPRVTTPFATSVRRHSFDLHALSTPPAFVLSQDQTLNKNLENLKDVSNLTGTIEWIFN
jgi:hypothetical protein